MLKKKVLLFLLLTFIAKVNYAQSDTSKHSSNGMIQFRRGFWVSRFFVDGKQISRADVNELLISYQPSAYEFNEYKKNKNLTTYFGIAAVAFLITPLITDHFKTINSKPGQIALGLGYGFTIPVIIFGFRRDKHYNRSFNLYNRQFQK